MIKQLSIAAVLSLGLSGCATFAENPNNATEATSNTIVDLAEHIESAQAQGLLSESEGDKILINLKRANELLSGTSTVFSDISVCDDSSSRLECVDDIMKSAQEALQ